MMYNELDDLSDDSRDLYRGIEDTVTFFLQYEKHQVINNTEE